MKKLTTLAVSAISVLAMQAACAQDLSKRSLVERALTQKDHEVLVGGALGYGDSSNDSGFDVGLGLGYGLTDDLTIGLGGIRYRFMARDNDEQGLELTFGGGLHGVYERHGDNIYGYGADVTGKYVMSPDFAVTFSTAYTFWNDRGSLNREEISFGVGTLYEFLPNMTWITNAQYRDLRDFNQSDAYSVSTGVNYALSKQMDVGMNISYTNFNTADNGFDADSHYKRNLGAYMTYRF